MLWFGGRRAVFCPLGLEDTWTAILLFWGVCCKQIQLLPIAVFTPSTFPSGLGPAQLPVQALAPARAQAVAPVPLQHLAALEAPVHLEAPVPAAPLAPQALLDADMTTGGVPAPSECHIDR